MSNVTTKAVWIYFCSRSPLNLLPLTWVCDGCDVLHDVFTGFCLSCPTFTWHTLQAVWKPDNYGSHIMDAFDSEWIHEGADVRLTMSWHNNEPMEKSVVSRKYVLKQVNNVLWPESWVEQFTVHFHHSQKERHENLLKIVTLCLKIMT